VIVVSGCNSSEKHNDTSKSDSKQLDENGTEKEEVANLLTLPASVSGYSYKCRDIVRVVNRLRHLGKERAIRVLTLYAKCPEPNDRGKISAEEHWELHLLCRVLFENPEGWGRPAIGGPDPEISDEGATKRFSSFPIAFSRRIPFLVVGGYILGGMSSPGIDSVKRCSSLQMIGEDLPIDRYNEAARELVETADFRLLYPDAETRRDMTKMILNQAL